MEALTVGVDAIITTDIRLAEHYNRRYTEIKSRFNDMTLNLTEPYKQLRLPQVVTTATVLTFV